MIHLNLGIYEGEVQIIKFNTQSELCEYLQELDRFDCIWLATEDGEKGEVLITENLQTLINAVKNSHFNLLWNSPQNFYIQEYQTYEDAYKVAFDMREGNPRCYSKSKDVQKTEIMGLIDIKECVRYAKEYSLEMYKNTLEYSPDGYLFEGVYVTEDSYYINGIEDYILFHVTGLDTRDFTDTQFSEVERISEQIMQANPYYI